MNLSRNFKNLFKASAVAFPTQYQSTWSKFDRFFAIGAASAAAGATWYMMKDQQASFSPFMRMTPAECEGDEYKPCPKELEALKEELMELCDDELYMCPILVRLSWHDAGTYDKNDGTGGPRGCMRFRGGESAHGANAGLDEARNFLAPIKAKYPSVSNADLWSLAAVCAIKTMGGPDIPWRAGRVDASYGSQSVPDGRLPDATQGCPHLRDVFHRMGFTDQEIVALSGAHALGMCHGDRSGFIGPWTLSPLSFDNAFFVNLVTMKWKLTKQDNGLPVFKTESQNGIIMLPTDVDLLRDEKMVAWVRLYAADNDRFRADFASAFCKLQELGVPAFHNGEKIELY